MAIQRRNDEQVALLAADFQQRYESSFAWRTACPMFQALTGLRGFWPMSAMTSAGNALSFAGSSQTRVLTYNGNPTYDYDGLAPYIRFDGTGDYLRRNDEAGLDILGTEAYIAAGHRGLTLGGWFRPENDAAAQHIISKMYTLNQYSYALSLEGAAAGDPVQFTISNNGAALNNVQSTTGYSTNEWQFFAGRFNDADTGEELAVWNNTEKTTAASAFAAIFNGTDNLGVGGRGNGTLLYTGRASMVFLCAAALADATIWALYQNTRALYKV